MKNDTPRTVVDVFRLDDRIAYVREYLDGWIPDSGRWAPPGEFYTTYRGADSRASLLNGFYQYSRRRPGGDGPAWEAFAADHQRIAYGSGSLRQRRDPDRKSELRSRPI